MDGRWPVRSGRGRVRERTERRHRRRTIQNTYLEVVGPSGSQLVRLEGERFSMGSTDANDIAIPWDGAVSKLHAVFERYPSGWCVRDLGSKNGTHLNGERITAERALRSGDEIVAGTTRILFRLSAAATSETLTSAVQPAPELTRREREVLIALCRPILGGNLYTDPASIREIASELVVSESAVKKHLQNLYDKFAMHDAEERRRGRLVSEAIRRGAVRPSDART